jgi:two-component system, cell cycle sensor histidine kinase PleC
MRQAPERATCGPLQEDLADCDSAALLIDVGSGAVLDANPGGWGLLGVETQSGPLPLDCAMPAMQTLRRLSAGSGAHNVTLTFWTPGGHGLRVGCAVSTPAGQGALRMVRVLAVQADRQSEHAAIPVTGSSPQPLPDVALRSKLAHELRTPLGAVIAYAEILKDEHFGPMASDRYKSYARNIHESARHAMAVLEGMLKGEEEASGVPQLTFADIDPARIVEACLLVAEPLAEKAGLALSAEVPPNLPRVVADAVSLRQMLLNLLANAIKFARRGDRVRVTVAYDADGPLRISVVDTGPGMEHADHAAGKGVPRQERRRSANAGLGLGLPLTRSLATANGAVLAIDSALGRGTCATISFGKDRLVLV